MHKWCAASCEMKWSESDGDQGETFYVHNSEAERISYKITCMGIKVSINHN